MLRGFGITIFLFNFYHIDRISVMMFLNTGYIHKLHKTQLTMAKQ